MLHLLSTKQLEQIMREAVQQGARQARIEDFLAYVGQTKYVWLSHGVNVDEIVENLKRDAEEIIDIGLQPWHRAWLDPWWSVGTTSFEPVISDQVTSTTPQGPLVPLDKRIAWHLYRVTPTKIVADPQALRFYASDRQILAVIDGAIERNDRLSHLRAFQLTAPYTGLDVELEDVPARTSSVVFTKDGAGSWSYTVA